MKLRSIRILAILLLSLSLGPLASSFESAPPLFFTPVNADHKGLLAAIDGAQSTLHMTMFRITHPALIEGLIRASARGVDVRVILDRVAVEREKPNGPSEVLMNGGVKVLKSSTKFSLSHNKSFTIDNKVAYIMSLNLTKIPDRVRDVGIATDDKKTVDYVEQLFAADWNNGLNGDNFTPPNIPDTLVVSPVNARNQLRGLIQNAKSSLQITVENLSYNDIIDDVIAAQARGVHVEVLLPRCNYVEPDFNMPAAVRLNDAGVDVRLMPGPETAELPYIHQKSMSVDNQLAYLGSENFSYNSLEYARELGIIINDPRQLKQLSDTFYEDFNLALKYPEAEKFACPPSPFSEDEPYVYESQSLYR